MFSISQTKSFIIQMRQKLRKRESLGDDHTAPGLGIELKRKEGNQASIVAHACHPRAQKVEAGALGAQSDSLLHTCTVGGQPGPQEITSKTKSQAVVVRTSSPSRSRGW